MADTQRRALALAHAITERLILLAYSRGRRHLKSPPRWMRDAGLADTLETHQACVARRIADELLATPLAGPPPQSQGARR